MPQSNLKFLPHMKQILEKYGLSQAVTSLPAGMNRVPPINYIISIFKIAKMPVKTFTLIRQI